MSSQAGFDVCGHEDFGKLPTLAGRLSQTWLLQTAVQSADARSLAASRASRIRGISAVDGASAGRAWIAIEGKAAVATDKPPAVAGVGINVNGATDEAYRGHFRLLVDTCTVATMHAKQVLRDRTVDNSHTDLSP
jgi:hypothetical protein